jgi:DNA repair exonuclease SbcCD nuclease subunit
MTASSEDGADFCFVHAADLHLDTPFKGVSAKAPEVAKALREASLDAFDQVIELCLGREAAFLVIAGDVYDGAVRGLRAQLRFRDGLERLSEAGVRSFVAHGNHDPVEEGWSAVERWPELVHVFAADQVEAVAVEVKGKVLATVLGISYPTREVTENLALRFAPGKGVGGLKVGVLHCNVAGAPSGHLPYSPCTVDDLLSIGLDYWALGHVHTRSVLAGRPFGSEPWIVYPGNLQGRSPKPSELGPKGASVVTVRGGRVAAVEHVDCDQVRIVRLDVDVSEIPDLPELQAELSSRAAQELDAAAARSLVIQASLSGRGDLHQELIRPGVAEDLLAALNDDRPATPRFAYFNSLEDRSRPTVDVAQLRHGDDFAADVIATADELASKLAGGLLEESYLSELLGKAPREIERLLGEIAREAPQSLAEEGAATALDYLGVGS